MLAILNDLNPVSKTFYSQRIVVKLIFHEMGGLDGQIYPFASCHEISSELSGLYTRHGASIQLGFTSCFHSDHLSLHVSMYSGEILRYDQNKECLILKWVIMGSEHDTTHSDIEVLLDDDSDDFTLETRKILEYVNSNEVMMC